MGEGILLSESGSVDFMIHGVFSYELFGQTVWITTTHVCVLIVFLVIIGFCIAANRRSDNETGTAKSLMMLIGAQIGHGSHRPLSTPDTF